ncbi:MAG: GNAT family N-acetyltransferase [Oscillibacter sp.]|nr:GNAT family N-acetyltransferase [Oscillibacter sp.]
MLYLQPVSLTDGREFYDMLQRIGPNENGFINHVNGMDYADFPAWLARHVDMAQGIGLEDWMVPASTFWLMADGVPMGQGNLRHRLTDALREGGGHIGYAIASDQRGKGYGKEILRLMLEEARRMGITEDILITVNPDNIPSRKVAEANGGELRRETAEHVYYWFQ